MTEGASGQSNNHRVRLAELQRDVQYTAAAVEKLTAAVNGLREDQQDLVRAVAGLAQGQAVFEACARQWQSDHEDRHGLEGRDRSLKTYAVDIITALVAAIAGILIQPGGGS